MFLRLSFMFILAAFTLESASATTFEGVWQTTFGGLRLAGEDGKMKGVYEYTGYQQQAHEFSTIEGKVVNQKYSFKYSEGKTTGEGWFKLAEDGDSFQGVWRESGERKWHKWDGVRIAPQTDLTKLMIIEGQWEESRTNYSFGSMLETFFSSNENVKIERLRFTDKSSFIRALKRTAFLTVPTVLVIAGHGSPEGLETATSVIDGKLIGTLLRHSANLKLLHFSACSVMKDQVPSKIDRELRDQVRLPISGYTNDVDWNGSAIAEFLYLDLILNRDFEPRRAAQMLPNLTSFAGSFGAGASPIGALGFRFTE